MRRFFPFRALRHAASTPWRRYAGAAAAAALLAHCSFPEYSFEPGPAAGAGGVDASGGGGGGASGRGAGGGSAGRGGEGTGGAGPTKGSGGRGGGGGSGGEPACEADCPVFVVTTTLTPVTSFVSDGTKALWTQLAETADGDVLFEAPLAAGAAASPLLGGPDEPVLRGVDAANAYLVGPRDEPETFFRFERAGGGALRQAVALGDISPPTAPEGVFVTPGALYFKSLEPGTGLVTLYAVPKSALGDAPAAPVVASQAQQFSLFALLGVDGDAVVLVDLASPRPVRVSRLTVGGPSEVTPVFDEPPGAPLPSFVQFGGDAERVYVGRRNGTSGCNLQTMRRDQSRVADLTALAPSETNCFEIRSDDEYVYWLARERDGQALRAVVKDGSRPPVTVSDDVGAGGYAVHGGYAYWVSADSRAILGKRVH